MELCTKAPRFRYGPCGFAFESRSSIRTYDQARRFYRVRSSLVHTDEPAPARDSLYGELEAGRDLACRSLGSLLKCDIPVGWAQVRPYLEREAEDYVERVKHQQFV